MKFVIIIIITRKSPMFKTIRVTSTTVSLIYNNICNKVSTFIKFYNTNKSFSFHISIINYGTLQYWAALETNGLFKLIFKMNFNWKLYSFVCIICVKLNRIIVRQRAIQFQLEFIHNIYLVFLFKYFKWLCAGELSS